MNIEQDLQSQINDLKSALGTTKKAWREKIEDRLALLEDREYTNTMQADKRLARLEEAHKKDLEFVMKALEAYKMAMPKVEPSQPCPSVGEDNHDHGNTLVYCPKCHDKPAPAEKECISISREVAEKWLIKMEIYSPNLSEVNENMITELRKSLAVERKDV
jgi:hypothetical protein